MPFRMRLGMPERVGRDHGELQVMPREREMAARERRQPVERAVAFRAVDRERLLGRLEDADTARKHKELSELLAMLDLVPVDGVVIDRAKASFAVTLRAFGAIHVATAEASEAREAIEFWTHDDPPGHGSRLTRFRRPRHLDISQAGRSSRLKQILAGLRDVYPA